MKKTDPTKPSLYLDINWLEEEFVVKRRTLQDIGEQCGVTREAVRQVAKKFDLIKPPGWALIDGEWLREERGDKHRSMRDLADEIGVTYGIILSACRHYGISNPPKQTPEEVIARDRARSKKYYHRMYATSPEFRAMKNARSLQWRKDNPEKYSAYQRGYSRRKRGLA